MNTIIALVAMIACIVVLTKPWGYEESVQEHSSNAGSCGTSNKTLESGKEDPKEC